MTFQEYLAQDDPEPQNNVVVTKEDCAFFTDYGNGNYRITLDVNGKLYVYYRTPGVLKSPLFDNTLYTEKGTISCFEWKE